MNHGSLGLCRENRFFSFDEPRPHKPWFEAMGATKKNADGCMNQQTKTKKNFLRRSVRKHTATAPGGKPLTKRRCTERRKASAGQLHSDLFF